ncbi:amidase [Acidiphilium sp. AL]|uniref:Amidase n=1 Tax=Acidiphilium iwatense TaxID=768198 RepID=A0ABS9DTV3_9PROT|nr:MULTISPECIES: amidase [Acidiphilium]MCF3946156.1 amidase [Acidiphilium iwatense]MCU4158500.1 amidase [Acidiphilium sp. AL]
MALTGQLQEFDATALAALVAKGDVSAGELLEAALARIDAAEPRLNAVAVDMRDKAHKQAAGKLTGPFAGVPFLLKDILQDYAGSRMTLGAVALRDNIATRNAAYVDRCLAAGLVIIGSTATPELGLKATTETILHGATRNPWGLDRTPGGSSGGSAAAVAARILPMAGASDGGGSIRIPAAYCGLFGLKPSRGRISEGPANGEGWEGAVCSHVLTRSVRDSAAMLDVLAGPEPGDPFVIPPPARPYAQEVGADPGRLRIGFSTRSPIGGAVAPEMTDAVAKAATLLESLGHHVEEAEPDIDGGLLSRCYMGLYFGHVAALVDDIKRRKKIPESSFHPDTRALALLGRAMSAGAYVELQSHWNGFARALGAFHASYDLFLTPVTAMGPARIGELETPELLQTLSKLTTALHAGKLLLKSGIVDQLAYKNLERTPFTQLANLTFVPAMSVPLHWGEDGMPVGVQFTARFGEEHTLLRLAAQLEQVSPWANRKPNLK